MRNRIVEALLLVAVLVLTFILTGCDIPPINFGPTFGADKTTGEGSFTAISDYDTFINLSSADVVGHLCKFEFNALLGPETGTAKGNLEFSDRTNKTEIKGKFTATTTEAPASYLSNVGYATDFQGTCKINKMAGTFRAIFLDGDYGQPDGIWIDVRDNNGNELFWYGGVLDKGHIDVHILK
jgi:hypothetical protein